MVWRSVSDSIFSINFFLKRHYLSLKILVFDAQIIPAQLAFTKNNYVFVFTIKPILVSKYFVFAIAPAGRSFLSQKLKWHYTKTTLIDSCTFSTISWTDQLFNSSMVFMFLSDIFILVSFIFTFILPSQSDSLQTLSRSFP